MGHRLAVFVSFVMILASDAVAQEVQPPDTVLIESGSLVLKGLIWKPTGEGPHPAILFNHGSGPTEILHREDRRALGPLFAKRGYVFLFLDRRGAGMSASQGRNSYDVINTAMDSAGQSARNAMQLRLLESDDLRDARAALEFLRRRRDVDRRRIALVGHSFGGSLTLILAEMNPSVRAAVVFGAAAGSWKNSPELQSRLRDAVVKGTVPALFIHAANDYSIAPGIALADEMDRARRSRRLRIFPATGTTAEEGHDFIFRETAKWESDVFEFLDARMR